MIFKEATVNDEIISKHLIKNHQINFGKFFIYSYQICFSCLYNAFVFNILCIMMLLVYLVLDVISHNAQCTHTHIRYWKKVLRFAVNMLEI